MMPPASSPLKAWKKLTSQYLHRTHWFSLRRDRVLKGSGQEMHPYYVLEYTHWATVFPITPDGKIILVKQYRYGLAQWSIEVPGGMMDAHETDPMQAAKRELQEETGYTCGSIEQVAIVAPNPATANNVMYCFLAKNCTRTHATSLDENEELEVMLVTMAELKQMLKENKILQALHITCMMYALQQLGEISW